jgi:hypothetical protein
MNSALCEGDACDAVTVAWDRETSRYVVHNNSGRPVRVHFQTWPSATEMRLDPWARVSLDVTEFEHPYRATYCD